MPSPVNYTLTGDIGVIRIDYPPVNALSLAVRQGIMDGLEAAARIRAEESQRGRHTPIVAMTAHAMKGDRERCLAAGMDGYVAKPIRAREMFQTMGEVLAAQQ